MRTRRQHFGQHFLTDPSVISKIVDLIADSAKKDPVDVIVEIGPGKGALTLPILENKLFQNVTREWVLIEKDPRLQKNWENFQNVSDGINKRYIEKDALDFDWRNSFKDKKIFIYSNLPYSTGTRILLSILESDVQWTSMVLMFQKEVAERLYAKPRTKPWGSLALTVQNKFLVEPELLVPPNAFRPPPKVTSQIVRISPRHKPLMDLNGNQMAQWENLVHYLFQHRRKMIRAALKGFPDFPRWMAALEKSGLSPTARAEELDFFDWQKWLTHF